MKVTKQITGRIHSWATPLYENLPLWYFAEPQLRFKAYCIGMDKTGTVSMTIMFNDKGFRTMHEPENRFLINKILAFYNGKMKKDKLVAYIKQRDRRLSLEMEASHLNIYLLAILVNEFSNAKFILTMRDCYSWLDSQINHVISKPKIFKRHWTRKYRIELDEFRFKAYKFKHTKEEKILADNGFYTLDGYFSYWAEHNNKVITTVPSDRLLIVKTKEINRSTQIIENFLGIESGTLSPVRGNKGKQKFNILSKIDKSFLEEKANLHCGELMNQYFPEIKGFESK